MNTEYPVISRYDMEDDGIERYAEKLILQKRTEGLNVLPIQKAKKRMSLGRYCLPP